jgi:hypothetical protein
VSSRFGTGVDASFSHKGQGLWVPARRPGRRVERSRARPSKRGSIQPNAVAPADTVMVPRSLAAIIK